MNILKLPRHPKIAVFRALQLGDLLCAIPAIRSLRTQYSNAHISLIGLPQMEQLLLYYPEYMDRFIAFPGFAGLPEQQPCCPRAIATFFERMRGENFDLILQMHGNGTIVNSIVRQCGAGMIAGFHKGAEVVSGPDALYVPYPEHLHEVRRHLYLMEKLNIPVMGEHLEFSIKPCFLRRLHCLHPDYAQPFVCLHPGSRGRWRQWPPSLFASIGDLCHRRGFQVLITGTAEEAAISAQVQELMLCPSNNLSGKTSLGALAALLKQARLLISNCTGVAHLADALQTPSVVVSMDGEAFRWASLDTRIHRTIDWLMYPDYNRVKHAVLDLILPRKEANQALG